MSPRESERIRQLGFAAIVLVAFIHGTTGRYCDSAEPRQLSALLNDRLQASVAFGFARVAVPYFFLISGFLFFLRVESQSDLLPKLKRRFFGLVVPYLAWSALWIAVATAAWISDSSAPASLVDSVAESRWLETLILDPIPGQFWFIRDLIVLVSFSPLILFGFRILGWTLPLTVALIWLLIPEIVVIENRPSWQFVSLTGAAMFTLGGWFSRVGLPHLRGNAVVILLGLLWASIIASLFLIPIDWSFEWGLDARRVLDRIAILLGIAFLWSVQPVFRRPLAARPFELAARHTFFIFAAHYPLLGFVIATHCRLVGCSALSQLIAFLLYPLVVIGLLVVLGSFFCRRFPHLYGLLSGYRGFVSGGPHGS